MELISRSNPSFETPKLSHFWTLTLNKLLLSRCDLVVISLIVFDLKRSKNSHLFHSMCNYYLHFRLSLSNTWSNICKIKFFFHLSPYYFY